MALVFFGFFWLFLVFFGIGFGQNSKLETGFFWFFLAFFGFFWHRPWPTSEIGNWFFGLRWFFWFFWFFLGFFGFFWYLNLGLEYHPKKYQKKTKKNQKKPKKNQKNPKKNQKKPVATPKLVNWLGFFWFFLVFFGFFWGEHPPNQMFTRLGCECDNRSRRKRTRNLYPSIPASDRQNLERNSIRRMEKSRRCPKTGGGLYRWQDEGRFKF